MRHALVTIWFAAGLLQAEPADAVKAEIARLKGSWSVVGFYNSAGAREAPPEAIKNLKLVFGEDKVVFKNGDQSFEVGYTVDPAQKPAAIDLSPADKAKTTRGIYELERDLLTLCTSAPGQERPREFKTNADTGTGIIILQRDP